MLQEDRYEYILKYLKEHGSLVMTDLVKQLGVSRETLRRDLRDMEEKGLLTKVHGGAVLNKVGAEPAYAHRTAANAVEKKAIAEKALSLVEDGDTLFIDNGTTALEFAKVLQPYQNLVVFTHSLPVAMALVERNVKVYLAGGLLRQGELSLSGAIANSVAENFYVDKAFIGAGGVSLEHGITDFHVEEAEFRRKVISKASKTVVLADYSKFGIKAFVRVCALHDIDYIVADNAVPLEDIERLKKAGTDIEIAE